MAAQYLDGTWIVFSLSSTRAEPAHGDSHTVLGIPASHSMACFTAQLVLVTNFIGVPKLGTCRSSLS